MSETQLTQIKSDEKKLLSDEYEQFIDMLEALYIKKNISGRILFAQNHPALAARILGEELIALDTEGTSDRKARMVLEHEAAQRQQELLERVSDLEKNSQEQGTLNMEFIETLVNDLGRDIALQVYDARIVNRILPSPPGEEEAGEEQAVEETPPSKEPESAALQDPPAAAEALPEQIEEAPPAAPVEVQQPAPENSAPPEEPLEESTGQEDPEPEAKAAPPQEQPDMPQTIEIQPAIEITSSSAPKNAPHDIEESGEDKGDGEAQNSAPQIINLADK